MREMTIQNFKEINMKKILTLALTFAVLAVSMVGCGSKSDNTVKLKDDYKIDDISKQVELKLQEKYGEEYLIGSPVDEAFLKDGCLIDMNDIEEFSGAYANNMVRNDAVVVLKAKSESVEKVAEALKAYKQTLIERYQTYPVGGSFERAENSDVMIKGNYVIFLCVGDFNMETEAPQFEDDMAAAKETVNSLFNA